MNAPTGPNDLTLMAKAIKGLGMKTSLAGRQFIQRFEACKLKAYPDPKWHGVKRTPANESAWGKPWTIGWGHTGPDVHEGKQITQATADNLFAADLARFEDAVNRMVTVPLNQGQFDALVSFAFNCGEDDDADTIPEGLGDSTLLKRLNAGQYATAADEFRKWNKSGGKVLSGLTIRRAQERAMFLGQPF